ncbi:MAG: formylglycine-generating enzyme family protein, partial [Bacteroidetes bacterium]|nr:formylglycine-generating enzyme family protein [Bacteroidota bacterium]
IKKDSPLAVLKELLKIKRHDLLIGDFQNEVLIPEVVLLGKDSISVGKFEVTNAQFAQFKTNHTYSALHSNFPVTSVSHSDAMAYTQWLSEKTGKSFRLPNVKEAEKWNEKAVKSAKKENTLNYLAGYDLTLDDAKKLQSDLETLKMNVVKEVGSFDALKMNKSDIYDLAGNVREMTLDTIKVYGFGALDFADLSNPIYFGGDLFTGFRVVLEIKK